MDQTAAHRPRAMWAYWIAAALAAVGGIGPLLLGGIGSRVTGAAIPFVLAAIAYAVCARLHTPGKGAATVLYFLAGLAIVYGILFLVALPLRLAVLGTCPPQPSSCTLGAERQLTDGESTSIGFAIAFGMVAILVGFYGLASLYRRHAATPPAVAHDAAPPLAHGTAPAEAAAPEVEPEASMELPAPEELLELPPPTPEHTPELPPPGSPTPQ